jgi:hypothetical protein
MEIIFSIIVISLVLGLLFRKKGDGLLDTIQSGCWILIVIAIILLALFVYGSR